MIPLVGPKAIHVLRSELKWLDEEIEELDKLQTESDSEATKGYFRGRSVAVQQEYSRLLYWMDEFEENLRKAAIDHAQENQKAKP